MRWSALERARSFGRQPGLSRSVLVIGVCSALLVPLLLLDLGLIVQLLVSRGSREVPSDWVLGPWVAGRFAEWPFFGQYELCLLALVAAGSMISVLEAFTLLLLQRGVQKYALRVATSLRSAVHGQAFRLGSHELLGVSRSRPEELFEEKVEMVRQGLVLWWLAIPRSLVALASLILLALAVNFWLTLLAVLLSVYVYRTYQGLRRRAQAHAQAWRERAAARRVRLVEALRLAPLTTGYALDAPPGELVEDGLQDGHTAELRGNTSEALLTPILLLVCLLSAAFLLLVVGLREDVTVAGTVLLGSALICAYYPAARLYRLRQPLAAADAAASEVFGYLDREPSVGQMADARPLDRLQHEIALDRITLADRYGRRLLDNVSLTIPVGCRAALIASDPQTPMALAGLFVRYYDPAAGRLLYDKQDIQRATLDTVRGQALLVSHNGPLFSGTIAENIACQDSGFTTHQITDAAKQARAAEFIQQLPQGLNTVVGPHGVQLRDDQAFRIALARALLREPSLLVVEEPHRGVDEATASQLEEVLRTITPGRTLIVLPSLLPTLRSADRIYLFHNGALHASGTHVELLQTSELYRHLNYVRFNAFRDKVSW